MCGRSIGRRGNVATLPGNGAMGFSAGNGAMGVSEKALSKCGNGAMGVSEKALSLCHIVIT